MISFENSEVLIRNPNVGEVKNIKDKWLASNMVIGTALQNGVAYLGTGLIF